MNNENINKADTILPNKILSDYGLNNVTSNGDITCNYQMLIAVFYRYNEAISHSKDKEIEELKSKNEKQGDNILMLVDKIDTLKSELQSIREGRVFCKCHPSVCIIKNGVCNNCKQPIEF